MKIHRFPLGQMQSNCYLLEKDEKALLIDPGDSADFLLEQMQIKRLELLGIIATHGHFDHIMAVGEIQLSYPDVPLYIHFKDQFLLKRFVETARHFLGFDPVVVPVSKIEDLADGKIQIITRQLADKFQIFHTPGHTPGSCCIYFKKENILFSGDTLFKSGIGRYDFSYSDKDLLKHSIQNILKLPEKTSVYPGHGPETSIGEEKYIIQTFF